MELAYPVAGFALARRLELAEALDAAEFAEAWLQRHPVEGGAVLSIAGGLAAFGGAGSPLSHAVGIGMTGPVSESEIERLEQFYRARGAAPTIDLCPLADPTLSEILGGLGYRIAEFNNVLVRPLDSACVYRNDAVSRGEDEFVWAKTVSTGFFDRAEFTLEELELTAVLFHMTSGVPWIAVVDGEPAAAVGLAIQDRLALLFGDSTIPRFRRRGWHTALIRARLAYAAAQGCDLAVTSTLPGSLSQSNYEKLGFRLVYTKLIMTRG